MINKVCAWLLAEHLFCSKYKRLFGPWFLIGDSVWILSKGFNEFQHEFLHQQLYIYMMCIFRCLLADRYVHYCTT